MHHEHGGFTVVYIFKDLKASIEKLKYIGFNLGKIISLQLD